MTDYTLRGATDGDIPAILDLFLRAFGKPLSEEFYRWRFFENPFGPAMIELAWHGDELAAHYGVCGTRSALDGRPVVTAQSMTTMTDPLHEGKGLFTRLSESLLIRIARDHGVSAVWGFPNRQSHFGFVNRLGWYDLYPLFFLSGSVLTRKTGTRAGFRVTRVPVAGDEMPRLSVRPARIRPNHRDAEWFAWRYGRCPLQQYHLVQDEATEGWCIFKTLRSAEGCAIDVLELEPPGPVGQSREWVDNLLAVFAGEGAARVNVWLSMNHSAFPMFERAGFVPEAPITYMGVRPLMAGSSEEWSDPRAWVTTMGDSDVF